MAKATLGAGCFWCAEAAYKLVPGVVSVTSGYAGGDSENPTYEEVSSGKTGHVEAVQIVYNLEKASFEDLLKVFWKIHNPTEKNKQGPDTGPQYQAALFYHTEEQKRLAEESKEEAARGYKESVMTEILPFKNFYPAEEYHKDFYERNPEHPYSKAIIEPKVQKVWNMISKKN